jgi:insertion element IS1 protein InsB
MWSFYRDKKYQIWRWRAIGHETGEAIDFRFGTREHGNLDRLLELLKPLDTGHVYTDGNYAYYERFSTEVLTITKKNTQKTERKHLSLRRWSARLVRKGLRFSKTAQMHKIVVALANFGPRRLLLCQDRGEQSGAAVLGGAGTGAV